MVPWRFWALLCCAGVGGRGNKEDSFHKSFGEREKAWTINYRIIDFCYNLIITGYNNNLSFNIISLWLWWKKNMLILHRGHCLYGDCMFSPCLCGVFSRVSSFLLLPKDVHVRWTVCLHCPMLSECGSGCEWPCDGRMSYPGSFPPCFLGCWNRFLSPLTLNWNKQVKK